jgi:competence protein ComEC
MTVKGGAKHLERGDCVACLTRLKRIRNFQNPGAFNYERFMAFKGLSATAYVNDPALVVRLCRTDRSRWRSWIDRARRKVGGLIERIPSGDSRGVLKALVVGDRSEISSDNRRLFARIGVSHLLAISGLHVGMVATLSFLVFRTLLSRSETMLLRAWVNRAAAMLSILPVLAYGLLAGMSPSTQRAVVMVTVFLLAAVLEREGEKFNTLAVAALIILLIAPTTLFNVSFQLSFAAVFAILYCLERLPWVPRLRSAPPSIGKKVGLLVLVSASAILGTLPITLYYFNQTSLIGLASNCILVPIVGFTVVPLSLLAVVVFAFGYVPALALLKTALFILDGCLGLAHLLDRIPFAATKAVTPSLTEMFLYYILFFSVLNWKRRRWTRVLLVVSILAVLLDVGFWYRKRFCHRDLRATFIDVGQGSAVLLELPGGPCMLIDGGGFYGNRFDVGERIVAPFLWRKKIATVETLVLSHPNADHLNGLVFIARHFNVREFWHNEQPGGGPIYRDLRRVVSEKDIQTIGVHRGSAPRYINGVRFDILYPPKGFMEKRQSQTWRTTNNNSLVVKASLGQTSFLFSGDIEDDAEVELVAMSCDRLRSRVLLVPHHGSAGSSTPGFSRCVDPRIAVITAGWNNVFDFPHEAVVQRYKGLDCLVLRTDRHGAVTIRTDGTHLSVETFRPE